LAFEFYNESYAGSVMEVTLGKGDKAVTVGGETCYPFYQFEGEMPHKPKLPWKSGTWHPKSGRKAPWNPFKDVVSDQRHGPKNAWTNTAPKLSCCN
jgi:acetyl-CoA decarbonylase/synthase complex subunit delta